MSRSASKNNSASKSKYASGETLLSVPAAQIEAMLFLASEPVSEGEFRSILGVTGHEVSAALDELREHLARGHGLVLRATAGGWVLETNPHFAEVLSVFRDTARRGRVKLSKAAVETLSVIAYNQPVTRGEVEELRGVRCEGVIVTLLSHGLIRTAGHKKASGSPLLYRTTPRFLDIFGLEAIADLPSLEEMEELGADPENPDAAGYSEENGESVETGEAEEQEPERQGITSAP